MDKHIKVNYAIVSFSAMHKRKNIDETRFDLSAGITEQKDNDFGKLKTAVEFPKNKISMLRL